MLDMTNHDYPPSFDIAQYFVALCFHDFWQYDKFQLFFKVMTKLNKNKLQKTFHARNQKYVSKSLYH
jgi:hypothetical protein